MAIYRQKRNIEASLIDQINEILQDKGWTGISVVKSLTETYKFFPAISIDIFDTTRFDQKEIGSYQLIKIYNIQIRIFAENDGQRLDLSDCLLDEIEKGFIYYTYEISSEGIVDKTESGRITILRMRDDRRELRNTENLTKEDKFRHLISFDAKLS